jgi:hypothetical protein
MVKLILVACYEASRNSPRVLADKHPPALCCWGRHVSSQYGEVPLPLVMVPSYDGDYGNCLLRLKL